MTATLTPSPVQTWETLEAARETFEKMQDAVASLARDDAGKLMKGDAWLRYAMSANEILISEVTEHSVYCYGTTFTTQTQSNESFDFEIPLALVLAEMQKQG